MPEVSCSMQETSPSWDREHLQPELLPALMLPMTQHSCAETTTETEYDLRRFTRLPPSTQAWPMLKAGSRRSSAMHLQTSHLLEYFKVKKKTKPLLSPHLDPPFLCSFYGTSHTATAVAASHGTGKTISHVFWEYRDAAG